jgi:hypothetical protein
MNTLRNEPPGREEIEALLPWHAAGTLNRRDSARVEEALAHDPELARRYELVREELGETIHLNESLGPPSARAMERLMSVIDAEPARRRTPGALDLRTRFAAFISALSPRTLAWSASGAILAIILQAGLLAGLWITERTGPGYETASYGRTAAQPGTFAIVRFAPQASAADITRLLEENKITVVDGPKPGGLYRVRVADTRLSKDELDRIISRLQQDRTIAFAAPAD